MLSQEPKASSFVLQSSVCRVQKEPGLGAPLLGSVESSLRKSHRSASEEWGREREEGGRAAAGGWEGMMFRSLHWGHFNVLEGGSASSPAAH